jgi:hypothetical protein
MLFTRGIGKSRRGAPALATRDPGIKFIVLTKDCDWSWKVAVTGPLTFS